MEVEPILYAHTPATPGGEWHALKDHTKRVAELAAFFGEAFDQAELCRCLGLFHDAGKASPAFQAYLQRCAKGQAPQRSVPHAAVGAKLLFNRDPLAAMAVLGHHAGLSSPTHLKHSLGEVPETALKAAAHFIEGAEVIQEGLNGGDNLQQEVRLRMAFSALVDADYLDTEQHFDSRRSSKRSTFPDLRVYRDRLRAFVGEKAAKANLESPGPVNETRFEVLQDCRLAALQSPGAFRLTVPTGGGKTLSGLTFALDHAIEHGQRRIIVAIPYTSIIDQTVDVFRQAFGDAEILEHHSAILRDEEEDPESQAEEERRKLAAENWDAPVVVTTTLQLFESLFANRPSKCRKLHRIVRSVIVLDEVQTLPTDLLQPTLDMIRCLVEDFGCTVVFCTATQPNYNKLDVELLSRAREIVQHVDRHFTQLKRVEFHYRPEPWELDEISGELRREPQTLCILNTRKDAVRVTAALSERQPLHLSTNLAPIHRKQVIAEVRRRLDYGEDCLLVSTQVVEAGVDLDFPSVYRALGPLDRIVQAAGRCNREGKLERGNCTVFSLVGASQPAGSYKTGSELAETLLRERLADLERPASFDEFFADLYSRAALDPKQIQAFRRKLDYAEVARLYKFISEDTVSVVVRELLESHAPELLRLLDAGVELRFLFRRLQPFTVSLRKGEFESNRKAGSIQAHPSGVLFWVARYDAVLGIGGDLTYDPEILIS